MIHGTMNAYRNHGCRCKACRNANAAYMRAYQQDHRARGLCVSCSAPAQGSHVRCARHHEGNLISQWNLQRKAAGIPPLTREEYRALCAA